MNRVFVALALAGAVLAGCGGEGGGKTSDGSPAEGRQGGKLTVLWTDDVDFIDPGQTYYQPGYQVAYATQRPLYSWKPDDSERPVPDLAASDPQISADGKTVTVKLRDGVRFSPPVDREVTAADVKYAIERGFFSTVNNGYAGVYFADLVGAQPGAKPGIEIEGIETPDAQTIVFHLARGTGGVLAGALTLPLSAPVPQDYAKRFDARNPSSYGQNQVATGPYMIENDAAGKAIGYQAGRRIHLVRNPSWDRTTDYKPAYLDEIDMPQGNDDTTIAAQRVLQGSATASGDFSPPPAVLADAARNRRDQLALVPAGGLRFVSMNTTVPPFDDVNVRRAVIAGFDREAMRKSRGGEYLGDIPTHILSPGVPGFEEAGGLDGPGLDFMSAPSGDPELAAEYFRKAGYASGRYEGDEELMMVGTTEGVAQQAAEVAQHNLEQLGFDVRLRLVTQDAMLTRFCTVPAADVAICPNMGWGKDFSDAQTLLGPTFDGDSIVPQGNPNAAELDVPEINAAMDEAALLTDPRDRAEAWAEIDRMVTEQAPVIPWIWDKAPLLHADDVEAVANEFTSQWDLAWTSLRQ
jgi:peptide/nickel transport system substrate-binding protein